MSFYSPLRYPGGKRKLAKYITKVIETNNLSDAYIELFAGGSGIALHLLANDSVGEVYINDISFPIYSFWYSVLNQTESLCQKIVDTEVTIEEWHRQQEIFKDPKNHPQLDIAFATFFLNRTNFSGILNGGIIGGYEQTGKYKLDARYNKLGLIRRIEKIATFQDRIHLYNQDAAHFIKNELPQISINSLLYLDPPYYVKGKKLYINHYTHEDHETIAQLLADQVFHPWVVSYDNVPEIIEIYKRWDPTTYDLHYNANQRYFGKEVMFFNENMIIPELEKKAPIH